MAVIEGNVFSFVSFFFIFHIRVIIIYKLIWYQGCLSSLKKSIQEISWDKWILYSTEFVCQAINHWVLCLLCYTAITVIYIQCFWQIVTIRGTLFKLHSSLLLRFFPCKLFFLIVIFFLLKVTPLDILTRIIYWRF